MNRDVVQAGGEVLVVSQFTLLASTRKGNRPSYVRPLPSRCRARFTNVSRPCGRAVGAPRGYGPLRGRHAGRAGERRTRHDLDGLQKPGVVAQRTIYPWGDTRRFNSYAGYFRRLFGGRVQKLSVDAGFTCPNRDGTVGRGGCTFCDNGAFTPSYCGGGKSVARQIAEGIDFHRNRYRTAQRYLVYFQSYSNTYAPGPDGSRALYRRGARRTPTWRASSCSTRPDCLDLGERSTLLCDIARDPLRGRGVRHRVHLGPDAAGREPRPRFRLRPPGRRADRGAGASRRRAFHPRVSGRDGRAARRTDRTDQRPAADDREVPPVAGLPGDADGRRVRRRPRAVPFLGDRASTSI